MGKGLLLTVMLLVAGTLAGRAQEVPVTVLDGPVVKADTLENKPRPVFRPVNPFSSGLLSPSFR